MTTTPLARTVGRLGVILCGLTFGVFGAGAAGEAGGAGGAGRAGISQQRGRRAAETIREARSDPQKRLAVTLSSGRVAVIPLVKDQTAFADPAISRDRRAAGAQAQFANCCTSYDLPLQLVIYRDGRTHRFTGNDLPIFNWHFADDGRRVAYGQQPAHFGCVIHYELRDIDTERLLDSADIPEPCGLDAPDEVVEMPLWVKQLLEDRQNRERP